MAKLDTSPRIPAPDDLYEAIIAAHRDLDAVESRKLDAKLILLLANHIGDTGVVREALAVARAGARPDAPQESAG
jgi:3-(3-hydroxy-phenyl)propionate hydroxylase